MLQRLPVPARGTSSSGPIVPSLLMAASILVCLGQTNAHASPLAARQDAQNGRIVATVSLLEGSVRWPGVTLELRTATDKTVLAKTVTDGAGQATFPDIPPGRYVIEASGDTLRTAETAPFEVRAGDTAQVLIDVRLTYTAEVNVRPPNSSPTNSVQPVSTSDMISGNIMDLAPLEGDDFQSLLPLLPGVVRGQDGRLRVKGGQPTQGALQISSASLVDPSTGDFDLDIPGQSIESVEVLANPFAAEYGRFTTSVTQIRTKRGTNEWEIKPGGLMPRFRKGFSAIRGFEPKFSIRGPLERDRVFFSQDFQFRYVATPVKSLPDEPVVTLRSFDSFTRIDSVLSSRHTLGGGLVMFPREIERIGMNTFRPPEVNPDLNQSGLAFGAVDRFAIAPDIVLESTLSARFFELEVGSEEKTLPMAFAPELVSGNFYNDQERDVHSLQLVEALSVSRDQWHGQHVFKFGIDLQLSGYDGSSLSRPVEIRRIDGSLAELTEFGPSSTQEVNGTEFAVFAQDRWRFNPRVTFEVGMRFDRDSVVERINWSPRAGVSISVLPEGEGILRGGFGKFAQRTPLNVGAHNSFESRTVTRFAPDGTPLGPPITFFNVTLPDLRTPEALVGNIEWNQRFGRRFLFKTNFLHRQGSHEYIIQPDPARGVIELASEGSSRYWEVELTGRYLGGERRDITVSYVRSHAVADLNSYDQFYGNLRNPIIRANERNLTSTDVPNRLLVRGNIGLPGKWDFSPVFEFRSGFPWSAVDEFLDFVGPRNRTDRLPTVTTLDFSLSRPWHFKKYRFRAGIRIYNTFGASADRDVQNNLTSPNYGQFYNPIERSIGFVFGSAR
jgi:hypothetical protein